MKKLIATLVLLTIPTVVLAGPTGHARTEDAVYKCKRYMDRSRHYHWRAHSFPWGYSRNHQKRDYWEHKANPYCGELKPDVNIVNKNIIHNRIEARPERVRHSGHSHHPKHQERPVAHPERPANGYKDEMKPLRKDVDLDKEPRNPEPEHRGH